MELAAEMHQLGQGPGKGDADFGAIAVARDQSGAVIASASSGIENGRYTAVDEASYYAATGQLLPMQAWEEALLDDDPDA